MWHNRAMSDEQPWSKLKSTIYSAIFRNPKSTKVALARVPLSENDRLLDIGCGPGAAIRQVASRVASGTGVDASDAMITIARQRAGNLTNVDFAVSPAENLAYQDGAFTVVWTIQSWHHWNNTDAAYAQVKRVLEPGGRFFIIEKETDGLHGLTAAAATRVADELASAGFGDIETLQADKMIIISAVTT